MFATVSVPGSKSQTNRALLHALLNGVRRQLIEDLPFTYLHVFTYSPRPGTPAAARRDQVPVQVARERNRILRDLAAEKKLFFMQTFVGRTVEAITLNVFDGKSTEALTDNYLKLRLQGQHETNQWASARVEQVEAGALLAVRLPT